MIGAFQHLGYCVGGGVHVQRGEYAFVHKIFPALPGFQLDDFPHSREHQVVVKKGLSHGLLRLQVLELFEQLLSGEVGFEPDEVVSRYTRSVGQHVVQSDVVVEFVVVELDGRHRLPDRLIPGELSFFHQHPRGHRREQLAVGSDLDQSGRRERKLIFIVAIAVSFGEDQLVVHNNAYADPGRIPILQRLLHVRVKTLQLTSDVRFLSKSRGPQGHQRQDDRANTNEANHASRATLCPGRHGISFVVRIAFLNSKTAAILHPFRASDDISTRDLSHSVLHRASVPRV